jgi:hypothetical protein
MGLLFGKRRGWSFQCCNIRVFYPLLAAAHTHTHKYTHSSLDSDIYKVLCQCRLVQQYHCVFTIASTNIACGQTTKKTSTAASAIVAPERTTKKIRLRFPYCCMTPSPEQTPKKRTVPSIVALLRNGCKQVFPLLTVELQRARHNIIFPTYDMNHNRHTGDIVVNIRDFSSVRLCTRGVTYPHRCFGQTIVPMRYSSKRTAI